MNDILKKRIEEAAVEHAESIPQSDERKEYSREDFIAGAYYALSHQWISVEESLPEYNKAVLIIDKTGIEGNGVYFNHRSNNPIVNTYENGFCDIGLSEVMYWCEVPKFETRKK